MNFLDVIDNCSGLGSIVKLIKDILGVAFIFIAIVLIIFIIIDLAKAVIASDEKEVKGYQKTAIRRVVYAVAMFFVVAIITAVFNLLGNSVNVPDWAKCWNNPIVEK